jgi:hypothetical protein
VLRLGEAVDRLTGDRHADEHEERGLAQRREVLGLAVTERVVAVGRAAGHPDGEERQQRGDEVGARVQRLGDQAEASGDQAGDELERDQRGGGGDRQQRGALLRGHARAGRRGLHPWTVPTPAERGSARPWRGA